MWLVYPANRAIEVFRRGEPGYELTSFAPETGPVRSVVLDGFEVDLAGVYCSGRVIALTTGFKLSRSS